MTSTALAAKKFGVESCMKRAVPSIRLWPPVDCKSTCKRRKTVAMLIQPPTRVRLTHQNASNFKTFLQGQELKFVEETRLLGIMIDNRLSWSAQVASVCSKVGRKIGVLKRCHKQSVTPYARRSFFISVIQHDLEYAAAVSTPSLSSELRNCLPVVWSRALRCAFGLAHPTKAMSKFFWLNRAWHSLTDIVKQWMLQFAVLIRRCHREEAPSAVCNKLKATSHGYQTRGNKASYFPFRPYTISGSKCFSARDPLLWNALPVSIREEKHLVSFKNKLLAFVESRHNFNKLYDICFSNTTSLLPIDSFIFTCNFNHSVPSFCVFYLLYSCFFFSFFSFSSRLYRTSLSRPFCLLRFLP